jgi:hypothetical protein
VLIVALLGLGASAVALHTLAADQPIPQAAPAPKPVTALKANPTVEDLSAALGITWWQFDLPKTVKAIDLGVREKDRFERFEHIEDVAGDLSPGPLKIAYQEDGLQEYKLVMLTKSGRLQLGKKKKPADFTQTFARAKKNGEFFELMHFFTFLRRRRGIGDMSWSSR